MPNMSVTSKSITSTTSQASSKPQDLKQQPKPDPHKFKSPYLSEFLGVTAGNIASLPLEQHLLQGSAFDMRLYNNPISNLHYPDTIVTLTDALKNKIHDGLPGLHFDSLSAGPYIVFDSSDINSSAANMLNQTATALATLTVMGISSAAGAVAGPFILVLLSRGVLAGRNAIRMLSNQPPIPAKYPTLSITSCSAAAATGASILMGIKGGMIGSAFGTTGIIVGGLVGLASGSLIGGIGGAVSGLTYNLLTIPLRLI